MYGLDPMPSPSLAVPLVHLLRLVELALVCVEVA